jgi:hypothetical protein
LEAGADPNFADKHGWSPLLNVVQTEQRLYSFIYRDYTGLSIPIVQLLVDKEANPNQDANQLSFPNNRYGGPLTARTLAMERGSEYLERVSEFSLWTASRSPLGFSDSGVVRDDNDAGVSHSWYEWSYQTFTRKRQTN